jgi:hypothetical protein
MGNQRGRDANGERLSLSWEYTMTWQAVLTITALGLLPVAVLLAAIDANRNPT